MKTPLGYDASGSPLDVPEAGAAWRVRRTLGRPGRPQTVYDSETGRQLELPITGSLDDLRACGCGPGRYRLEAVDAESKALVPAVIAFVEVVPTPEEENDDDDGAAAASFANELVSGNRAMKTVERQADALCRAVEAMARAFGPVHPAAGPDFSELATLARAQAGDASSPAAAKILTPEAIQSFGLIAQQLMQAWQSMRKAGES